MSPLSKLSKSKPTGNRNKTPVAPGSHYALENVPSSIQINDTTAPEFAICNSPCVYRSGVLSHV